MEFLVAALAAASVFLFVVGIARPARDSNVTRRIGDLRADAHLHVDELSLWERVVSPVMVRGGRAINAALPQHLVESYAKRLERAGRPVSVARFFTLWLIIGVVMPSLSLLGILALGDGPTGGVLLATAAWSAVLTVGPPLWLRGKAKRRVRAIDRSLPDAIDLIVTNVEAGVGLQAALMTVGDKFQGPLAREFRQTVVEISLGRSREEALDEMAERTGVPDVRLFANAIAQAERSGISISSVLRSHARESRERRRQRAREQAAKIPVKITIPTVLFIFPTLFMVILGPVVLKALAQFRG